MGDAEHTAAAKLVALLEALSESDSPTRDGLTVAELARAMGRDKSIVSRQLKPLVAMGVVERSPDRRHSLGWRLFAIAAKAGDQRLLLLAPPVMARLTQLVRERCHLSIRRGQDVLTILSESPQRPVEAVGWVGRTSPVNCTSSGRALLLDHTDVDIRELFVNGFAPGPGPEAPADVEELVVRVRQARSRGFAVADAEFDADVAAVAAPVRDVHGRIVAALNISAPAHRFRDRITAVGGKVAQAAAHLSRSLYSPETPPVEPAQVDAAPMKEHQA